MDLNKPGDWEHDLTRRVERLEAERRSGVVEIGKWVLEVNQFGELVARNTESGVVTVVAG